jgi:uncharacterized membrane protein
MRIFIRYLKRIIKHWGMWIFLVADLIGIVSLIITYFDESISISGWSFGFLLAGGIVFLFVANVQIFAEQESKIAKLQKEISILEDDFVNGNSLIITPESRDNPYKAIISYIRGNEALKNVEISLEYTDSEGNRQTTIIHQELIMRPNEEIEVNLPSGEEEERRILVRISGVGTKSGKKIYQQREIVYNPKDRGILLWKL